MLHDEDPILVNDMLEWFYSGEYKASIYNYTYPPLKEGNPGGNTSTLYHAGMYALADKYRLSTLKTVAMHFFRDEWSQYWPSAPTSKISMVGLQAIKVAYTTTPETDRGLRDIIKFFLRFYGGRLKDDERFKELYLSGLAGGQLAKDVSDALSEEATIDMLDWDP